MAAVAALLASVAVLAQAHVWSATEAASVTVARTPPVLIAIRPVTHRTTSCKAESSHASGIERKLLPVACEQPPRSSIKVPNAATGGASWLFGSGR